MTFWSGEKLAIELPKLIKVFNPKMIDCNAYTLCVGPEAYITPDHKTPNPLRHTAVSLKGDGEDRITIPPGQFGFLLTEEEIKVPDTAMAFISMKSEFKLHGLINASGFHVDPGYKGKLIFSVFNAGPRSIHLKRHTPVFLIWYASLDQQTKKKKTKPGHATIPLRLINGISGEIQSAHGLSEKIKDLDKVVSSHSIKLNMILSLLSMLVVALIAVWAAPYITNISGSGPPEGQSSTSMSTPSSLKAAEAAKAAEVAKATKAAKAAEAAKAEATKAAKAAETAKAVKAAETAKAAKAANDAATSPEKN